MKLKTLALAPVLCLAMAFPALAEKISLNEISRYLNSLKTAKADFTQVNADGSISTGIVYIQRPQRVRFEYKGDRTLVMASAGNVAVFDGKTRGAPQQYPLSKTPLSLILAPNIDLSRARMVTGYTEKKNTTVVTAQDPQHPEYGNIQMVFTANPTQLRQWVVTDDTGKRTTVILGDMQTGMSFPASTFAIQNEIARRK
ncbi:LolA family protein [Paracoccus denitrificans]|jgi:outer membrane lipoprotein-sorting protein|uniref:Outer membrane lipoprotein carrier protein LolA n=1 Tax=Paracoccus denitrificans (strain Pd 1222) TaxID=318586 RepID=A1B5G2_PARDP|nr:outer membrane lipoprotein carrier protein LolA [Paracoccus denitrificans]ABL70756.1 outer membrane lipoprotein carrier protein LolA [Paracoccus denitrificans PD1222]MBB4628928.1 outer membrane lipoprotein-sorting protein [Paracoccus denitrificans]MCU7429951.1 outer membrane lipoprotein carrier protein LolA [Paracoccus denitrificans]QAR26078.1 outer membrane lipoprotein carrier protein LolA [Paracoccus denitrificans]UFS65951.1 outer membrane lipoprotein carrier protein LolA [Paracoccus deni